MRPENVVIDAHLGGCFGRRTRLWTAVGRRIVATKDEIAAHFEELLEITHSRDLNNNLHLHPFAIIEPNEQLTGRHSVRVHEADPGGRNISRHGDERSG